MNEFRCMGKVSGIYQPVRLPPVWISKRLLTYVEKSVS